MTTIDDFKALTRPSAPLKGRVDLAIELDAGVRVPSIVAVLEEQFGKREKLKVIKLIFDEYEVRYILRKDFTSSALTGALTTRGVGHADGQILPGASVIVKFIALCCPVESCKKMLFVTSYDENDPPLCDEHGKPMKPCDET